MNVELNGENGGAGPDESGVESDPGFRGTHWLGWQEKSIAWDGRCEDECPCTA